MIAVSQHLSVTRSLAAKCLAKSLINLLAEYIWTKSIDSLLIYQRYLHQSCSTHTLLPCFQSHAR